MTDTIADARQTDIQDFTGRPVTTLTVNNKLLAPIMARAASIASRNSAVPILACVLLRSSPAYLIVDANNLEMALRQGCAANGPERSVCVDAGSLNALLRQIPSDAEVQFTFDATHLLLKSGGVRAKLATLPATDFPAFRDLTYAGEIEIAGAELALALSRTRPFVSTNETRYYLSGVHMNPVRGGIRLEATDGKCVGLSSIEAADLPAMIIPARSVDEILRLIDDGPVRIRGSVVAIEVQAGGITFMSKLVDATYPDLDRVLATNAGNAVDEQTWRVHRDSMLRAVTTATAVGSASSIGEFHLSESSCYIVVEERDDKLKRDDEVTVELGDDACSFVGAACTFRIRITELISIIKAAGAVSEFCPNADLTWFRVSDVSDPRAAFVVGAYR